MYLAEDKGWVKVNHEDLFAFNAFIRAGPRIVCFNNKRAFLSFKHAKTKWEKVVGANIEEYDLDDKYIEWIDHGGEIYEKVIISPCEYWICIDPQEGSRKISAEEIVLITHYYDALTDAPTNDEWRQGVMQTLNHGETCPEFCECRDYNKYFNDPLIMNGDSYYNSIPVEVLPGEDGQWKLVEKEKI